MRELIKKILKYPTILFNKIFLYFYYEFSRKGYYYKDDMFKNKGRRILFVAPHVDDETIGAGGTLIKHGKNEDEISCVYMADGSGAVSDLSKKELVEERKREAFRIRDLIGMKDVKFMDIPDGEVFADEETVNRFIDILNEVEPYIIYMPFLVDGHIDHVNSSRIVIEALREWNPKFKQIYMYEVNTRIRPEKINNIVIMDKEEFKEKDELYKAFESQYVMGFDAFTMVDRAKRYITDEGYAIESFIRMDFEGLDEFNNYLLGENFNPNDFRQLSSRYNLFFSYMKNRELKDKYVENCKPLL